MQILLTIFTRLNIFSKIDITFKQLNAIELKFCLSFKINNKIPLQINKFS